MMFRSNWVSLTFCLLLALTPQAKATTIFLDFVTTNTSDIFGVATTPANIAFDFSFNSLNNSQIQFALLDAVRNDFLGYPTVGANSSSPLPNGKQLNVNILLAGTATSDTSIFYVDIGNNSTANFYGQACLACVAGGGPYAPSGSRVGSIISNQIASLKNLASDDSQRLNLLAGTISHEIGHTFSLDHPAGPLPNPGASIYTLLSSGDPSSTNMPNSERILDRAFGYAEFSRLITVLGTTDTVVPEPATLSMFSTAAVLLIGLRLRRSRAS